MSDPRIQQRTRPKSYTDQELAFLKSHLPEFERRTQSGVRGDAKKFALEKAALFISTFGLPPELVHVEEAEPRFKERLPGRKAKKKAGGPTTVLEEGAGKRQANYNVHFIWPDCIPSGAGAIVSGTLNSGLNSSWNTINVATPPVMPYAPTSGTSATASPTQANLLSPIQYANVHRSSSIAPMSTHQQSVGQPSPRQHRSSLELAVNLQITSATLRDSFSRGIDSSSLASMIQSFALANPSATPLTPVINSLFEAVTSELRDPRACLSLFLEASTRFQLSIIHAGVSGPLAGPRALTMMIRKNSIFLSPSPSYSSSTADVSSFSIADQMQRSANDRQRKKDHIQWARIHAAALELGMLNMGMGQSSHAESSGYSYAQNRTFSEMMARDAVWEEDECEWTAGAYVLRAVIRTAMRGDQRQRDEYEELLARYENRWKEIKDETRQAMEVLLGAKEDLARLEGVLHD
ncbi:hypothetical protein D9757_014257 [Collybiopsis confluens]|uniref:Uncharacterized protein n=1 Tax=Collybiopsis confluens TaxID=2823264 RepID=A0A8H5FLT0_9AGAR|nr:hypothetical protein D9757_014257 [Collybiopsis confluens]